MELRSSLLGGFCDIYSNPFEGTFEGTIKDILRYISSPIISFK